MYVYHAIKLYIIYDYIVPCHAISVLCLERGIAGFPQYFPCCPLKDRPVRDLGRTVESLKICLKSFSAVLFGSYINFTTLRAIMQGK